MHFYLATIGLQGSRAGTRLIRRGSAVDALNSHARFMREQDQRGTSVGQIEKRREKMADGRRYMIYYTFRPLQEGSSSEGETAPSTNNQGNNAKEQGNV